MDIEQGVKSAFATALNLPSGCEVETMKYGQVAAWDSTAHMVLIAELEAVFDIMMSTDDVLGLSSYRKAVDIVGGLTKSGDVPGEK